MFRYHRHFEQGQPAANPYGQPNPASDGVQQPEPAPTAKKWAGKFPSEVELEKGYENQQTVLTQRTQELAETRRRAVELETMLKTVMDRMSPAQRTQERSRSVELLESQGIPVDALRDLIAESVGPAAERVVDGRLAPLFQGAQARQKIAREFPGVNVNDVEEFIRTNPDVQQAYDEKVASSPSEALYYAMTQYALANREPADLSGQRDALRQARRDAALPGGGGGTNASAESGEISLADAWEKSQQTGNIMDFLRERLDHIEGVKPKTQR